MSAGVARSVSLADAPGASSWNRLRCSPESPSSVWTRSGSAVTGSPSRDSDNTEIAPIGRLLIWQGDRPSLRTITSSSIVSPAPKLGFVDSTRTVRAPD